MAQGLTVQILVTLQFKNCRFAEALMTYTEACQFNGKRTVGLFILIFMAVQLWYYTAAWGVVMWTARRAKEGIYGLDMPWSSNLQFILCDERF